MKGGCERELSLATSSTDTPLLCGPTPQALLLAVYYTVLLTLEQRLALSAPLLAAAGAAVQYTDALASDTLALEAEKSDRSCSCCRRWHQVSIKNHSSCS
jgi:hypothetical protein